jgi:hypothetical protein
MMAGFHGLFEVATLLPALVVRAWSAGLRFLFGCWLVCMFVSVALQRDGIPPGRGASRLPEEARPGPRKEKHNDGEQAI